MALETFSIVEQIYKNSNDSDDNNSVVMIYYMYVIFIREPKLSTKNTMAKIGRMGIPVNKPQTPFLKLKRRYLHLLGAENFKPGNVHSFEDNQINYTDQKQNGIDTNQIFSTQHQKRGKKQNGNEFKEAQIHRLVSSIYIVKK